jgi:hypothetical protein
MLLSDLCDRSFSVRCSGGRGWPTSLAVWVSLVLTVVMCSAPLVVAQPPEGQEPPLADAPPAPVAPAPVAPAPVAD